MRVFYITSAIVALSVTITQGEISVLSPKIAQCRDDLVSLIEAHWQAEGKPRNTYKTIEENGLYTLIHTTYNYFEPIIKCVNLQITDGVIYVKLSPKNGNSPVNLNFTIEQVDNEILQAKVPETNDPLYAWKIYSIYIKNGLMAHYVCGDAKVPYETPLISILSTNKGQLNSTAVNKLYELFKGWGAVFKYSYGTKCLAN